MVPPRFSQARTALVTLALCGSLAVSACRTAPDAVAVQPEEQAELPTAGNPVLVGQPAGVLQEPYLQYTFEVPGLSGSVEVQVTFVDVEDPLSGTTQRIVAPVEGVPPRISIVPSLVGLINGRTYQLTIVPADDLRSPWHQQTLRIAIQQVPAVPRFPAAGSAQFSRQFPFYWRSADDHRTEIALTLEGVADEYAARPWRRPATAVVPEGIQVWRPSQPLMGRTARYWLRSVHPSGILSEWVDGGEFVLGSAPAPVSELGLVHRSPVERPVLRWSAVTGAVAWEVELIFAPTAEEPAPVSFQTAQRSLQLDLSILERLAMSVEGVLYYRVRALNEADEAGDWSEWFEFQHRPLGITMRTVLAPGRSATARVGTAQAQVNRPFAMSRTEITAEVVVALGNLALEHGGAYLAATGLHELATDRLLVGLDRLTSGHQFTIERRGEVLAVREGYEAHPAVGVTWYGAVALANALSWLEGHDRSFAGSEPRSPYLSGYRLPTEAEWSLAAAAGYPGTVTPDARHSPRVNHFRSGDAFEDPVEPYTRNGGPTTPVGFLNNASQHGIVDLVGNVWEWCFDWYDEAPESHIGSQPNPSGPPAGVPDAYGDAGRVVRGAGWNTRLPQIGAAARGWFPPHAAGFSIGVRLVRTETP